MGDLLPSSRDLSRAEESNPRIIGLDDDRADDLLAALSNETARALLKSLHEEPKTPSEVADDVGTTLQNAQYHLQKLADCDAIEVVDTVYSEKGREMKIYAPADRPLVVFAGGNSDERGVKTALSELLGGVGVLALASLVVERLSRGTISIGGSDRSAGPPIAETSTPTGEGVAMDVQQSTPTSSAEYEATGNGAQATNTPEATETPVPQATGADNTAIPPETQPPTEAATQAPPTATPEAVQAGGQPILDGGLSVSPGLVFFLGGLTVLAIWLLIRLHQTGGLRAIAATIRSR